MAVLTLGFALASCSTSTPQSAAPDATDQVSAPSTTDATGQPAPSAEAYPWDVLKTSPGGMPEDAQDWVDGTPWSNFQGNGGTQGYSNSTFVAILDDGRAWAYVFSASDTFPPSRSKTLYLGDGHTAEEFTARADYLADLTHRDNSVYGITYVLVPGFIDPPMGSQWGAVTETDRSIERLRQQPWYDQIRTNLGVDLNDNWWKDKSLTQPSTISCPGVEPAEALPVLNDTHRWQVVSSGTEVDEGYLLNSGCTIN